MLLARINFKSKLNPNKRIDSSIPFSSLILLSLQISILKTIILKRKLEIKAFNLKLYLD